MTEPPAPRWLVTTSWVRDSYRRFGKSEEDAESAQKLGQPQPFIAVFPQGCTGQLGYFGPTYHPSRATGIDGHCLGA
jgi:hypothetical protein